MKTLMVALILFMTGCKQRCLNPWQVNQEKRIKLFQECLKLIPKPPKETHYSDWDEVVSECGTQAYYQSQELKEGCE